MLEHALANVMNIQLLGGNPNRNENGGGSDSATGSYVQNRPVAAASEIESGTDDLPF